MLRVSCFFFGLILTINTLAQETMSTKLNNWARSAERNSTEQIWLQFDAQLDYETLDKDFRSKNYSLEQRAQAVLSASKALHLSSMVQMEKWIKKHQINEDFWLGNSAIVQLSKNEVLELSANPQVKWMELTSENQIVVEEVEMENSSSDKEAINGAELGLLAINAHKIWSRGYTGKGRKALIIDTGIWPNHPSIADAWEGKRKPAQESWYGFDSPIPKDKGNSHGTHVTGTVLGLDPKNKDTVGVAFDATFMAADPVATRTSERKGLFSTVRAFEWVLDPNNGIPSSYKLPDVINNSWGRSTEDTPDICTNPFGDAVAACQLAGIAVVWSAGNNGPGVNTIGAPATITRNPYLVFTVGAINGNNSSYPIAGFSSRGPSYCAKAGIDIIKPEVVAPGVAVRSAVGQDAYASYQGTSMAGPHVAGAVLLLKEAFPNLPGQDILEALYLTATDLGPMGEDIAYGNGIINVDSAFLWLSSRHVASMPIDYSQDVSIELVSLSDSGISCANEIEAEFKIINHSDSVINRDSLLIVSYTELGQEGNVQGPNRLTQDINPGDSVIIKVKFFNATNQTTQFAVKIEKGLPENNNPFNDRAYATWKSVGIDRIPFTDDFANKTDNWLIDNPDNDQTWNVRVYQEDNGLKQALQLEYYNINQRTDQQDFLLSPKLLLDGNEQIQLSFDYAYTSKIRTIFKDSLAVEVTNSCNSNWKNVWGKGGDNLATVKDTTALYVPEKNDWESVSIDLSAYENAEYLQIRFVGVNDFGNNLYIDNVAITALQPASLDPLQDRNEISVFPNPTKKLIELEGDISVFENIRLIDLTGRIVLDLDISQAIDVSKLKKGVYVLELLGTDAVYKTKIVKE